jgi:class 3 adenylate cyclase
VQQLKKENEGLREKLTALKKKQTILSSENVTLEAQLTKAKTQVESLVKQISAIEGRYAKELKAAKKAEEAGQSLLSWHGWNENNTLKYFLSPKTFTVKETNSKFPTGTVTVVFSDVQSSTYQWEHYPEEMSLAMEQHNTVIREQIRKTGGYEVKTEGDSFMVAFHSPVSAVWFCCFVQEALLRAQWPPGILKSAYSMEEYDSAKNLIYRGLRVRMGAHVGKPQCRYDPLTNRMDYIGSMVIRAAKISGEKKKEKESCCVL